MLTRESLAALVAERDRCSGGRAAGCATCGLRHSCRLPRSPQLPRDSYLRRGGAGR